MIPPTCHSEWIVNDSRLVGRILVLVYGVVSYFIGVAGLACIIVALAKLIPFGFLVSGQSGTPILWNLALVAAWGIIHTTMARDRFKRLITSLIPTAAERPTYVLVAGITSILLIGFWQIVPGVIWKMSGPVSVALLWTLFAFGWVYLLASTFAINHFDLFGLRQVYLNFTSQPEPPIQFTKRAMYKFTRHPIQTGVLIGIWAIPEMTATHIVLSIGFTVYIFIGLWFEERDLVKDIGEPYEQYRRETGKVLPKFSRRS
jgi:protein-S-isoprenylcysteine O-methyltransferase Ste14